MDIKSYIESGILEQYVLGTLSAAEIKEVESNIKSYPAIANEVKQIEIALEIIAKNQAKTPVLSEEDLIRNLKAQSTYSTPGNRANNGFISYWWIPLLGLLGLLVYYITSDSSVKTQNRELNRYIDSIQLACNTLDSQYQIVLRKVELLNNQSSKFLKLNGTALSPTAFAHVIIDTSAHKVYFDFAGLPTPPTGKQYQLWVIKGGTPVDLGIIADNLVENITIIEKDYDMASQAYAITLEDDGGKPNPTLDQMYVIGELK